MRSVTQEGWNRIQIGFAPGIPEAVLGDPQAFWDWARHQCSAFKLAAWFILATADASESDDDLKGFLEAGQEFLPLRLARALDWKRREVVAAFIAEAEDLVQ